ncbi:MAG: c-type cytochrome [Arenicellales bacterium]|nr:c-type cytochrome [Arenicellales bacterium]
MLRLFKTLFIVVWLMPGVVQADAEFDQELNQALDLEPNIEEGRKLYSICALCHTPESWGNADGTYPQLAGQHRNVILKQLADIRAGNRDVPQMAPFAQEGLLGGPQGLADVAGYISTLPMNPEPGTGRGDNLQHGQDLYENACEICHGENGEGDDESFFPRIQGQHYNYLLRQLKWIRDGQRRNVYRGMVRRMRRMTDTDFEAVADYVSRLRPPKDHLGPPGWKNPDFPSE